MAAQQELAAAEKAIASTLRKNEKVYASLCSKQASRWQLQMVSDNIENFRTMLALIENALGREPPVEVEAAKREAAAAAIPGYIAQVEKILPKFQPGTSQHTLGIRRIGAYRTASALLKNSHSIEEEII